MRKITAAHQGSLICTNSERRSQAQNLTHQISAGTFYPNLFMTIYYILFLLQAHFSQICTRRHKILLMRPAAQVKLLFLKVARTRDTKFSRVRTYLKTLQSSVLGGFLLHADETVCRVWQVYAQANFHAMKLHMKLLA